MKRFTCAVVISLVLHVLIILTLTRAEIIFPHSGPGPGVTRATFVTINSGLAENGKTEEGNQEVEPEGKEKIVDITAEIPEPVKKPAPLKKPDPLEKATPEKKPVEKKKEVPVKKASPEPEEKEPKIENAEEGKNKNLPVKTEQDTEKKPGETSDKVQGSQDNSGNSSPKKETTSSGTTAPAENSSLVYNLAEGDVTRRVRPVYPRASRLRREEGQVVIIAEVRGGKVSSTSLESSSGHQRLDRAALEAVKKWEFAFMGERTVRIPVIFRLQN